MTDVICISHFWIFSALLPPPYQPKNKNKNKYEEKKSPGGIILHMCTKNCDHSGS